MPFLHFSHNTARGVIFILDGNYAGMALRFPINPPTWEDSHSANFASHGVIGRSHPKNYFTAGGSREINLEFPLNAKDESLHIDAVGVVAIGPRGQATAAHMIRTLDHRDPINKLAFCLNFLKALTYPRKFARENVAGEIYSGPPPVLFVWGKHTRIRCIVKSVKISYEEFDRALNVLRCTVSMSLEEQPTHPMYFQKKLQLGDTIEASPYSAEKG